jgi:hypothetical protein
MKRRVAETVLTLCLLFLACEILVRRWGFDQIPTTIDAGPTYALLALDGAVLFVLGRRITRSWASWRRTDKS